MSWAATGRTKANRAPRTNNNKENQPNSPPTCCGPQVEPTTAPSGTNCKPPIPRAARFLVEANAVTKGRAPTNLVDTRRPEHNGLQQESCLKEQANSSLTDCQG